ncbi:hypothetical protein KEM56_004059 [Ascosphaera pollenicola]|nr:hypothetical protein KEM56_004059 [Ascosphaera pollenicola]
MAANIIKLADIAPVARLVRNGHTTNICHITADITTLEVDCIVNAANQSLLGGGGVDGAIQRAAGPQLLQECRSLKGCDTGDAKITKAYELPCKHVIHTVGPIYASADASAPLLDSCYTRCMEVAAENKLRSIAFSAVSTGVYGYPSDEAAEVALAAVKQFLLETNWRFSHIIFCTFVRNDVKAYDELIPEYFDTKTTADDSHRMSHSPQDLMDRLPDVPTAEPGADVVAKKTSNNPALS